ncbi:MAG: type VI secretion system tip protein VgrG [Sedimentisphaerales bacterium]|nr:type VI secretion system tip protein VgrG [Sedimentisphaerales bacterium]
MAITQKHRELAIGTPLGEDVLLLVAMSGTEQLGRPFDFRLELVSEDHQIRFEDIIGQNVSIRLELSKNKTRYFNGYVSNFTQTPGRGRYAEYKATIVPWLWFLTRTSDCRIFQKMTVPNIIKQVFRDHGFSDFEDSLSGNYREWEYCVQYRETDFNFVSRLMEQEGIYYFFKHEDGKHTLVLADSASAHQPFEEYEEVQYRPPDSAVSDDEVILTWRVSKKVLPGMYSLKDFDFKNTKKDLQTRAKVTRDHAGADHEMYDYPGEYAEYADGENYARTRIEELQSQYMVAEADSDARGICAGCTFTLSEYPRDDQNIKYLITSAHYNIALAEFESEGSNASESVYSCSFAAIDATEPFRAGRITPKPSIPGPQTAIVVGPSGEEIHTDEYGRVKVLFHWDRYGKADENSSCWIRVAQVWAGKNWGAMYIPRIGQEVIIEFIEGDPDRPIITGRVYNGQAMPPYELPSEKTKSTLKSNSSKGGQGFNEIRYEDKKGDEQIFIHAEKNLDIRVKNDRFETIKNNRHLHVEKDKFEHVDNNRSEKVDADHKEEIGKDRHLKVKGKEAKEVAKSLSLTVKGDVIEVFKKNHSEQTTQNYYLKAMGIVIEAMKGITLKCGGSSVVLDPAGVTVKGAMVTIDGGMTRINSGPGSPPTPGRAGSVVAPVVPVKAEDADDADPGEVAEIKAQQIQTQSGKYGSVPVIPYKPPETEEEKKKKTSWIEIELVDEKDKPIPGERYKITLPDKSVADGTLDEKGFARLDGIEPGTCKICFPELDKEAWEKG